MDGAEHLVPTLWDTSKPLSEYIHCSLSLVVSTHANSCIKFILGRYFCKSSKMPLLCAARLGESIHRLLLVQAFRPDRLIAAMHLFVDEAMGSAFMKDTELVVGLPSIVEDEVSRE